MKKIAIISDTHGLLREEVKEILKEADLIIHAGDINTRDIVNELQTYAPLYIVQGNNDTSWACDLPKSIMVTIEGLNFFIVHNKKDIPYGMNGIDVVVYGHSHRYEEKVTEGVYMINPGSCGKRRFDLGVTMAVMEIENKVFHTRKILI